MKFLLDANIPYSAKEIFNERYQVFHVRDLKLESAADDEIIDWAKRNKSVLITRDLDFANILNYPPQKHSGIVVLRIPHYYSSKEIKKVLKEFISEIKLDKLFKTLVIVEDGRIRIKK